MINGLTILMANAILRPKFHVDGDSKGGDVTIASQGRGLDALYVFNHFG